MKLSRLQIISALKEQKYSPGHKEFIKKFRDYTCEELKIDHKRLNNELTNAAKNASQKYRAEGIWVIKIALMSNFTWIQIEEIYESSKSTDFLQF